MPLSQQDRIAISKKIVSIPDQNAGADTTKGELEKARIEAEKKDEGNKSIQNDIELYLNQYQLEVELLDGNKREVLTEQDMINSANRTEANFLFPNTTQTPLPSIPDGVWKNFVPFSGTKAIGKKYLEDYTIIRKEQDIINEIKAEISTIESFPEVERSSGQSCETVDQGSCNPDGGETTQQECIDNGGVWTPFFVGVRGDSALVSNFNTLKSLIDEWRAFLLNQRSKIVTNDKDATKQSQNDQAKKNIDDTVAAIDAWKEIQDFDTSSGVPDECTFFYNRNKDDFDASKLRPYELNPFKDEINARESFSQTRKNQVLTNLGNVNQDLASGSVKGGQGLYFERFRLIDQRLNIMNGSLSQKLAAQRGKDAQDKLKESNGLAEDAYGGVMYASKLKAPASNTGTVHVLDGSGFKAGNTVYVVAEKQSELTGKVVKVEGNTLFLDFNVSEKYSQNNIARVYKVL